LELPIDGLGEARESRASASLRRRRIANGGSDLIERFALRHEVFDFRPPGFRIGIFLGMSPDLTPSNHPELVSW
jgi:hypothetical protein